MIYGIGTDIIEIDRIKNALLRNKTFLERIFTPCEILYFESRKMNVQHIAGAFAAKEAVFKAFGTGLSGFRWTDIEIIRDERGKPNVFYGERVRGFLQKGNISTVHVSITHCKDYAFATAIAEYECK